MAAQGSAGNRSERSNKEPLRLWIMGHGREGGGETHHLMKTEHSELALSLQATDTNAVKGIITVTLIHKERAGEYFASLSRTSEK